MAGKWSNDPHLCILKTEYEDTGHFYRAPGGAPTEINAPGGCAVILYGKKINVYEKVPEKASIKEGDKERRQKRYWKVGHLPRTAERLRL